MAHHGCEWVGKLSPLLKRARVVDVVRSQAGVPIRLTDERWAHIVEEHNELAGLRYEVIKALSDPALVLRGLAGELLAVRELEEGKSLVVVYREYEDDGFVITAFLTRRGKALERRERVWPLPISRTT